MRGAGTRLAGHRGDGEVYPPAGTLPNADGGGAPSYRCRVRTCIAGRRELRRSHPPDGINNGRWNARLLPWLTGRPSLPLFATIFQTPPATGVFRARPHAVGKR